MKACSSNVSHLGSICRPSSVYVDTQGDANANELDDDRCDNHNHVAFLFVLQLDRGLNFVFFTTGR